MGTAPETFESKVCTSIRDFAMTFPEATEGVSCVNRAFKAGGKNFVFLGEKDAICTLRLKLDASVPEIEKRGATEAGYEVGSGGWTKIVFDAKKPPAIGDLRVWITESFRLLAPKKVAAQLPS